MGAQGPLPTPPKAQPVGRDTEAGPPHSLFFLPQTTALLAPPFHPKKERRRFYHCPRAQQSQLYLVRGE